MFKMPGQVAKPDEQEREWYKHKVTAPGLWLGYGATTFPAITEGELEKQWVGT